MELIRNVFGCGEWLSDVRGGYGSGMAMSCGTPTSFGPNMAHIEPVITEALCASLS